MTTEQYTVGTNKHATSVIQAWDVSGLCLGLSEELRSTTLVFLYSCPVTVANSEVEDGKHNTFLYT